MNVFIIGATGFLGSRVTGQAIARGFSVCALARSDTASATLESRGATVVRGDLSRLDLVPASVESVRGGVVLHLASLGMGHATETVSWLEEARPRRVIFISTTAVTTTLNAPSRTVRLAAEAAIRGSNLDWTILRPTMIYGAADDRNLARLLRLLTRVPALPLPGGGARLQQPVHVDDLAEAVLNCVQSPNVLGHTYDMAGPQPLSFRELVHDSAMAIGRDVRLFPVPLTWARAAAGLAERLGVGPRITVEQIDRLSEDKSFDISAAQQAFEYAPRSFSEGIRQEALDMGLNSARQH
jgi:uncharacterized protein YbjT (DUF2867 family)